MLHSSLSAIEGTVHAEGGQTAWSLCAHGASCLASPGQWGSHGHAGAVHLQEHLGVLGLPSGKLLERMTFPPLPPTRQVCPA